MPKTSRKIILPKKVLKVVARKEVLKTMKIYEKMN